MHQRMSVQGMRRTQGRMPLKVRKVQRVAGRSTKETGNVRILSHKLQKHGDHKISMEENALRILVPFKAQKRMVSMTTGMGPVNYTGDGFNPEAYPPVRALLETFCVFQLLLTGRLERWDMPAGAGIAGAASAAF